MFQTWNWFYAVKMEEKHELPFQNWRYRLGRRENALAHGEVVERKGRGEAENGQAR